MQLYYKCNKFDEVITKRKPDCPEKKCSKCQFKENIVMNWRCKEFGLDIKKKITYCGKNFNSRCEGCSQRGNNFEARF